LAGHSPASKISRAGLDQQCPGPEQIGELFQAFSQAELSNSKNYGGTGLELVLSRRFCQMMGGAGADDYDIKPIEIDRLLGKIQSLLSKGTEP
jgi:hypothetical protein